PTVNRSTFAYVWSPYGSRRKAARSYLTTGFIIFMRRIYYMPVLRIPTPLRPYTSGKSEVSVGGSNVAEALTDLTTQFPTIRPHLFNEGGELRPFVNLFLGENNIKDLQGVNTPIADGDKL